MDGKHSGAALTSRMLHFIIPAAVAAALVQAYSGARLSAWSAGTGWALADSIVQGSVHRIVAVSTSRWCLQSVSLFHCVVAGLGKVCVQRAGPTQ